MMAALRGVYLVDMARGETDRTYTQTKRSRASPSDVNVIRFTTQSVITPVAALGALQCAMQVSEMTLLCVKNLRNGPFSA